MRKNRFRTQKIAIFCENIPKTFFHFIKLFIITRNIRVCEMFSFFAKVLIYIIFCYLKVLSCFAKDSRYNAKVLRNRANVL